MSSRWWGGFLTGALLFGALPLLAEDVLRISPGSSAPLSERVKHLELAVQQLQGQVYGASTPAAAATPTGKPVANGVTCAIETPFDGAFSANAPTEAEARARTLEQCKARVKSSIYCVMRDVKCSG